MRLAGSKGSALSTMSDTAIEILSEIQNIETIATGRGVCIKRYLERIHGKGRWRKRREKQLCGWRMVQFAKLRYTGLKRMV
jgi:hypothetical protein